MVKPFPITTFFKFVQLEKALIPIRIKLSGINISARLLHCSKANSPISWTPSSRVKLCIPMQFLNAYPPIVLTLEGISMHFSLAQPSKALFPIVLTLFGITIASRLLQA